MGSRPPQDDHLIIAQIVGERTPRVCGSDFAAGLGFLVMILAIILESSAVRLTAWGAIWTGWNVLCAMGILRATRTDYIVYRVVQRAEPRL
jgi:hypothetical protein